MKRPVIACVALASIYASVGVGCSAEKKTQGELVLAIQTDMSLPKDVDEVKLEILTFGGVKYSSRFVVGATGLRIPATLGVLANEEEPNTPVTVRVIAYQKRKPRVLREVVTTVPPNRIASLRVPIQWISTGSARVVGSSSGTTNAGMRLRQDLDLDPAIESTCGPGLTDVGGECVDWTVDSALLPEYSPADVFGGGNGDGTGGSCFDTLAAFASPTDAPVDADCTIAAPAADPSKVNIALKLPLGGDGICNATACYIPLDSGGVGGWGNPPVQSAVTRDAGAVAVESPRPIGESDTAAPGTSSSGERDSGGSVPIPADAGKQLLPQADPLGGIVGGRIRLPRKVCAKIRAGEAQGVVFSTTVAAKTPGQPTCGPWSSVGAGQGGGTDTPVDPVPTDCSPVTCTIGEANSCACLSACPDGGSKGFVCTGEICRCIANNVPVEGSSFPNTQTCSGGRVGEPTPVQSLAYGRCTGGSTGVDGGTDVVPQGDGEVLFDVTKQDESGPTALALAPAGVRALFFVTRGGKAFTIPSDVVTTSKIVARPVQGVEPASAVFHVARDGSGRIVTNGASAYGTDRGARPGTGRVWGGSLQGGGGFTPATSVRAFPGPIGLYDVESQLYWAEERNIQTCSAANCVPSTFQPTNGSAINVSALAVANGQVFFSVGPAVNSCSAGTTCTNVDVHISVAGDDLVTDIAVNELAVFARTRSGAIWRSDSVVVTGVQMAPSGTARPNAQLPTGMGNDIVVEPNGQAVYFTTATGIGTVPLTGGSATTFATEQAGPSSLAVDDTHVYWTNLRDGTVRRKSRGALSDGTP